MKGYTDDKVVCRFEATFNKKMHEMDVAIKMDNLALAAKDAEHETALESARAELQTVADEQAMEGTSEDAAGGAVRVAVGAASKD